MKIKFKHLNILIVLSSLLFNNLGIIAQNLVKNPSFEQYNECPSVNNDGAQPLYWESFSTSTYYNSCANNTFYGVPHNRSGYQPAKYGSAYVHGVGIYIDNNRRTYNRGQFLQPLEKDSLYCVSYYICAPERLTNSIKNIDALLSKKPTQDWSSRGLINNALSQYEPQVLSQQYLNDSVNWMKVSYLYLAKGGEQYITIGNFNTDEQTELKYPKTGIHFPIVYYLLDMVSVMPTHAEALELGNDITLCSSQFPYTLRAPKGYDRYSWVGGTNGNNDTLVIYEAGYYSLTCFLDSCGSLQDDIDIGIKETPHLSLISDTTLCKGESLLVEAQTGFNEYQWNTGDTTSSIVANQSGTYSLVAIDQCGVQTDSVVVQFDSIPEINLNIGQDTNICNEEFINVPITLSANYTLPNYSWSNGATEPIITVQTGGNYWLIAEYDCGILKSNLLSVEACIPKKDIIFIPNAFSPNNDGLNDVFEPTINGADLIEMSIYNRWGEQIYSDTKEFAWDGLCGLAACQMGFYIYVIRYKDEFGNVLQRNGRLQLIN